MRSLAGALVLVAAFAAVLFVLVRRQQESQARHSPALEQGVALPPQVIAGWCSRVVDGDTLDIVANGVEAQVHLAGIDAPEEGQDFGVEAKDRLSALAYAQDVRLRIAGEDRAGGTAADVWRGDEWINHRMIADGCAWIVDGSSADAELGKAQEDARAAGRGLWGGKKKPVPPWEWRAERGER